MKPVQLPQISQLYAEGQNKLIRSLHGARWSEAGRLSLQGPARIAGRWPFLFSLRFSGETFHLAFHRLPFAEKLSALCAPLDPAQLPSAMLESAWGALAAERWGEAALAPFTFIAMTRRSAAPPDMLAHQITLQDEQGPAMAATLLIRPAFPFAVLAPHFTVDKQAALWPPQLVLGLPLSAGRMRLEPALWRALACGDILFPDPPQSLKAPG